MYILLYIKIGYQALRYIKMTKAKARPNIIFEIVYIFRTKMILKFIGARARFELKTLGSKLLFPRLFLINSLKTECDLKSIKNFILWNISNKKALKIAIKFQSNLLTVICQLRIAKSST